MVRFAQRASGIQAGILSETCLVSCHLALLAAGQFTWCTASEPEFPGSMALGQASPADCLGDGNLRDCRVCEYRAAPQADHPEAGAPFAFAENVGIFYLVPHWNRTKFQNTKILWERN